MNTYLIPVDTTFIETLAKAIARDRMQRDALATVEHVVGKLPALSKTLEQTVDTLFEKIWNGSDDESEVQKDGYRNDARAAINFINLKLLSE